MNHFELLCSMDAATDVLVHWIKTRKPQGELKVPPEVFAALLDEEGSSTHNDHLVYHGCKIRINP